MKFKLSSDKIQITGFILLLLIITLIITLTLYQSNQEILTSRLVDETQQKILITEKTHTAARGLETASRSFLLTGDPDFLETYTIAKKDFKELSGELKKLAADSHSSPTLIDSLIWYANNRILFADSITSLKKDIGFPSALHVVKSGKGKIYLDNIRRVSNAMQEYELNLLQQQKKDKDAVTANEQKIIIAIAWFILAMMILLFVRDRQNIRKKEQQKLAAILKKSEERFRVLSSNIENYVFMMLDTDGRIINCNSSGKKIQGYKPEEIIGKFFDFFYTKEDIEKKLPQEYLKKAREYGQFETEGYCLRKDGSLFWAQLVFTALTDEAGKLYGYSNIARDFTERKKTQEAFELLSLQINQSNDAIYTADANRNITSWNKGAEKLYGYTKEEVLGKDANEILKTDISPAELNSLVKKIDEKDYWTGEFKRKSKNGEDRYIRFSTSAIRDDNGVVTGYAGVNLDITNEKKLQLEINHLASLVEQSSEAIFSTAIDKCIISWNKGAEDLFGISKEEAMGNTLQELQFTHLTYDEILDVEKQIIETGKWKSERDFFHKNGAAFFGAVTGNLIKNQKGEISSFYFIVKDISIRKKLETQLKKYNAALEEEVKIRTEEIKRSEKIYRYLFENNPLPMWVIDLSTFRFLDVNEMAVLRYGYSREEFLSMTALDIRPEEDKESFIQSDHSFGINSGNFNKGVWNHRKKNGTIIKVEIIGQQIIFEGIPARFILANDITERKKAEEELLLSERRFRSLIENISDAIVVNDPDSNILYQSPSVTKILGYTAEERKGKKVLDYIHPGDRDKFIDLYEQLKISSNIPLSFEYRFLHKKGTYVWLEGVVTNLIDDPAVKAYVANYRDITERKAAEDALRKSEKIYKTISSSIPGTVICLLDREYRYLLIEGDLLEKIGYKKDILLGRKAADVLAPETFANAEKNLRKALEGEIIQTETTILNFDVITRFIPLKDENNFVYALMTVTIDITELKSAQRDISDLNRDLEEKIIMRTAELKKANDELEAFSYSVSHDLRAPLRAIVGFTAILEEDYVSRLDEEAKRISAVIRSNTLKMGTLIDDLLSFSRMGRHEIAKSSFNMEIVVNEVISGMDHDKTDKVKWIIHSLPSAEADLNTIRQVWINLIANAVKYSGKIAAPVIEIGAYTQPGETVYFIKDNGAGFDEKYKHKLFKVFQRLHSADQFEGTGIGLALVEKIISKHGGKVWMQGAVNAGACFYFSLPADKNLQPENLTDNI